MTCCFSPSALLIAASRCAFRGQDHGALLALGAHLLFHRGQHVVRRRDVLDLVAQHLHAPGLGRLVELLHDLQVDVHALFERLVEVDLADLAAQRRLRQLRDGEDVVGDAVRRALRVEDLEIQDAVHAHLHVVARDADLRRDVDRRFLQRMPVADDVEERNQDVKPGMQHAGKPAEPLDDVRALLRDDDRRLRNDDECDNDEYQTDDRQRIEVHQRAPSGTTCNIRPSTRVTRQRAPRVTDHTGIVARRPRRAAQLDLADAPGRQVLGGDGDFAHERIHGRRLRVGLHHLEQPTSGRAPATQSKPRRTGTSASRPARPARARSGCRRSRRRRRRR